MKTKKNTTSENDEHQRTQNRGNNEGEQNEQQNRFFCHQPYFNSSNNNNNNNNNNDDNNESEKKIYEDGINNNENIDVINNGKYYNNADYDNNFFNYDSNFVVMSLNKKFAPPTFSTTNLNDNVESVSDANNYENNNNNNKNIRYSKQQSLPIENYVDKKFYLNHLNRINLSRDLSFEDDLNENKFLNQNKVFNENKKFAERNHFNTKQASVIPVAKKNSKQPVASTIVFSENLLSYHNSLNNNSNNKSDNNRATVLEKASQRRSEKKKELSRLRRIYRQKKLSLAKQRSISSDFTETSGDEMDEKTKPTFKEMMFSKKMRKRAFWFIVVFLAALTVRDVVNLIMQYSEYPKQSDMNIRFNESMTMPNITFCMSRAQVWSHFRLNANETPVEFDANIQEQLANMTDRNSFLNTPWDYRTVMESYNLISTLTSMERETTLEGSANSIQKFGKQERFKELRKTLRMWLDVLNKRNVNFEEFMQKVGKETLRRSMQRFQRTSYNENEIIRTSVRITWISQMQFCFQPTFDEENFKPIEDQGNFFTMVLSHNAEKLNNQQVECMSVDFHGRASSTSRFSGKKGQAKDGFNDEHCMGMMHETTVEVKARYKMLANDEEGTACREHEDGEDSEFDCYARCRMNFIKSVCKCTAPTLSYLVDDEELKKYPLCDYTTCSINVQTGNYTDDNCKDKCHRDCDQIRFEIDHERKGKSARPDLTTIYLNWGSFEYLTLEQKWVWTASSFIAALGGSIGMWLGLSILSLIQGGTYMYKYLTQTVIKKKRRNGVSTTSDTDAIKASRASVAATPPATNAAANDDPIAANPLRNPFKSKISTNKSPPPEFS